MRSVNLSLMFLDKPNETRRLQPMNISEDLNLNKLLPDETIELLLTSAGKDEISARQELFREMENAGFIEAMVNLSESLATLSQLTDAYESVDYRISELEMLLLMRARCKAYLVSCSRVEALGGGSLLLDRLQEGLQSIAGMRAELAEALDTTSDCLRDLSDTSITLGANGAIKLKHLSGENISNKLVELIRGFSLEPNLRAMKQIRISDELSNALSKLHSGAFTKLRTLRDSFAPRLGGELTGLRREIEFYLDIHRLTERGRNANFPVCYPVFSDEKSFRAVGACDFTLLVKDCSVIPNDIDFDKESTVCFLTGANGGGKTTYLRCVAANLLLALGGCPIFAQSAEVCGIEHVSTHFPADESFTSSGRLVEEAERVDSMLENCTAGSFIFMNETYSGTDDIKGAQMTLDTAEKTKQLGAFALWVIHFHEVADKGYTMLTTFLDENDKSKRTYRIIKRRGDGSSHARDILRNYRLDAASLAAREGVDA